MVLTSAALSALKDGAVFSSGMFGTSVSDGSSWAPAHVAPGHGGLMFPAPDHDAGQHHHNDAPVGEHGGGGGGHETTQRQSTSTIMRTNMRNTRSTKMSMRSTKQSTRTNMKNLKNTKSGKRIMSGCHSVSFAFLSHPSIKLVYFVISHFSYRPQQSESNAR
ncbi:unnamed protein product [Amoebophrya sp. A25]|nr:unnamed protein product [Amoebophrya sp. A25]|eukprot:GSA25T00024443001.1